MLTYRVGAAPGQGISALGRAQYYQSSEHVAPLQQNLAKYYGQTETSGALTIPHPDMHPLVADRLGIDRTRPLTTAELANLLGGMRTDGAPIERTRAKRNAYIDLTFSAPKSLSVAAVLAPTERERDILLGAHRTAVNQTMGYIAERIGTASVGDTAGNMASNREPAHIAMIAVEHYTARPTYKLAMENGDTKLLPVAAGDPQVHTHVLVPNLAVTDADRATAIYQNGLDQRVHEYGAVYQAFLAQNLRQHGVGVELDSASGLAMREKMARLTEVPRRVNELFSKRTRDGAKVAEELAASMGVDFAGLSPEDKAKWLGRTVGQLRHPKVPGGEYEGWLRQAEAAGYRHRSVLRPGMEQNTAAEAERFKRAYDMALPLLQEEFSRRAVLEGSVPREAAAKGLIAAGIVDAQDVNAITALMRRDGVMQDAVHTTLHWHREHDRRFARVTTQLSVEQETEAIGLLREAAADKSVALTPEALQRAVAKVEARDGLDFSSEHGLKQRAVMERIAESGRAAVAVGVAGSGKSSLLRPLVEAWHTEGREVYGVTLAWRQTQGLRDAGVGQRRRWEANDDVAREAGIGQDHTFALARFFKQVERGLPLNSNSTVVVDELALVGTHDMLKLARLQAQHGFQLVGLGDDLQNQPIAAGATIDLARRAFGAEQVPELLSSTRQLAERDRETAMLWREGRADEALERKTEDGTLKLVPGGYREAIDATVKLHEERLAANAGRKGYSLGISVPTNADAWAFGEAMLARRITTGQVTYPQLMRVEATDQLGAQYELTLGSGSKVRLFDRVNGKDAEGRVGIAGVNGSVVEVVRTDQDGMLVRKASGKEATIAWADLRGPDKAGPVRLSYGDAVTIDARQSDTVTEHITAMPAGSAALNGFKIYTAESRHRETAYLVTSQGAEKQELQNRRSLGDPANQETDVAKVRAAVLENMARNLANQDKKSLAVDFMRDAGKEVAGLVEVPEKAAVTETTELLEQTDRALASIVRHGDHVDALLDQISAVRAEASPAVAEPQREDSDVIRMVGGKVFIEAAAQAVLTGEMTYQEVAEGLMIPWDKANPLPSREAFIAAGDTDPDPFELHQEQRNKAEDAIMQAVFAAERQLLDQDAVVIAAQPDPVPSQAARDQARAEAVVKTPELPEQAPERTRDHGLEA